MMPYPEQEEDKLTKHSIPVYWYYSALVSGVIHDYKKQLTLVCMVM